MTLGGLDAIRDALARHDWQAAFDAARQHGADSIEVDAEVADLEADAGWWLGRLQDCTEARERAYRLFEELGDHRRAGQCAVWLYEHYAFRMRPVIALAWLRRARHALEGDPECSEYGALMLREAEVAHGSGELDRAAALATAGVDLGRRLKAPNLEAEALQTLGRVLIEQGRIDEGLQHLDDAMLFAAEGRLGPYSTGKVYCSMIAACEEVDDFDRAAQWTESTLKWAEDNHPFAIFPGICRVHRAVVLKRRGSLAEAEREAARACDELSGQRHIKVTASAYAEVGDIRRRLGDLDEAEAAFTKAQELSGRPCGGLALLRLAQGRIDAVMATISDCLSGTTNPLGRCALLPMLVHVAIAAGDLDTAAEALRELEANAAVFGTASLRATVASTRGRLELARGDAKAVETLQDAVEQWGGLDVPYEVATARTLLAQALRMNGDEAAAAATFEAAAGLFDHIGARLDAELATGNDALRSLPAGLTEREVEVLRLIAAGMTNSEIADSLYLSVKTVSRHLSNIFTKIGVNSRAAATAFAFENALVDSRR